MKINFASNRFCWQPQNQITGFFSIDKHSKIVLKHVPNIRQKSKISSPSFLFYNFFETFARQPSDN